MRRIIHLSDLHFGRDRPELAVPLANLINDINPELVIISGDLTQRARHAQFRDAAAFINRIVPPVLSVPGNHDTPLDNLLVRAIWPFGRYRKYINENLEPAYEDDEINVVGVNTVNRFVWQRGRIGHHTITRICDAFKEDRPERLRIAVLHHPLEHLEETDKELADGADEALAALGDCGADVVLTGHLHSGITAPFTTQPKVLSVQAGTGLSTRQRGQDNTFNLLTVRGSELLIHRYFANTEPNFHIGDTVRFIRSPSGWQRLS